MKTVNAYYKTKKDFIEFLAQHKILDEKSLLVQIFSSELRKEILQNTLEDILSVIPQAKIIGATTDGEILENIVTTDKLIVSVTAFKNASLEVATEENSSDSFMCGQSLAKKILQKDTKAIILFTDGLNTNGENFLNGVKTISKDIPLSGGMAGDAAIFDTTYVLSNDGLISNGAVGVSINAEYLRVKTSYTFNWHEIGKELTVTKCDENRVYEIDNMKAVDIYKKYLGSEAASALPAVGIEFPLVITRDGVKVARAALKKGKHQVNPIYLHKQFLV